MIDDHGNKMSTQPTTGKQVRKKVKMSKNGFGLFRKFISKLQMNVLLQY